MHRIPESFLAFDSSAEHHHHHGDFFPCIAGRSYRDLIEFKLMGTLVWLCSPGTGNRNMTAAGEPERSVSRGPGKTLQSPTRSVHEKVRGLRNAPNVPLNPD